jgi:hypothetical protein
VRAAIQSAQSTTFGLPLWLRLLGTGGNVRQLDQRLDSSIEGLARGEIGTRLECARAQAEADLYTFLGHLDKDGFYWYQQDEDGPEFLPTTARWMRAPVRYLETISAGLRTEHLRPDAHFAEEAIAAFKTACDEVVERLWENHFKAITGSLMAILQLHLDHEFMGTSAETVSFTFFAHYLGHLGQGSEETSKRVIGIFWVERAKHFAAEQIASITPADVERAGSQYAQEQPAKVIGENRPDRRATIDAFIRTVSEAGREIKRKDIWCVAHSDDATEFERFQRGDPRATRKATAKFNRILSEPEKFIELLDKKSTLEVVSPQFPAFSRVSPS